jgi:ATP-dependent Zn protease
MGNERKLGPMTFGKKEEEIFLGRDFTQKSDYSKNTAIEIDAEIRRIIQESYQRAKDLLTTNLRVSIKWRRIARKRSSGRFGDRRHSQSF